MKKLTTVAIAATLIFTAPVFANADHHPEGAQANKGSATSEDATAASLQKMQDNVKKMQAQLHRVAKAKTDEERQKAMAEHMKTMEENMDMAHEILGDTMDCDMKHEDMMGGHMGVMGKGGMGMMGGDANCAASPDRLQQMERRLDMMQMMMEQMMHRQEGAVAPAPTK